MTIVSAILCYLAMGMLVSFGSLYVAHKRHWDEIDRNVVGILGFFFWPMIGLIVFSIEVAKIMNAKAKELAQR